MLRHLILWLASKCGLQLADYTRLHNGGDAVERGQRWEAFYREAGGIADMIQALRAGYFEAYAGLGVSDHDRQYEYALADRLARELDREVRKVIETGRIEASNRAALAQQQSARILR